MLFRSEFDAISAHFDLGVLYPYLNKRVVSFAAALPLFFKYRYGPCDALRDHPPMEGVDKYLLRLAFQDRLPRSVLTRPRSMYSAPFASWLARSEVRAGIEQEIRSSPLWSLIGADTMALSSFIEHPLTGNAWRAPFRFWMLYQLSQWWALVCDDVPG